VAASHRGAPSPITATPIADVQRRDKRVIGSVKSGLGLNQHGLPSADNASFGLCNAEIRSEGGNI
jgi:hypothetical protein